MSLEEYRDVWQEQEPSEEESVDEIVSRVKQESAEYERKIFWRDVREIGASVLVAGLFAYEAVTADLLLARIGAVVVAAGALLVIWRLRRARANGDDELAGRPVADRLRGEIEKVEVQIELLESVLWWYLGPMVAGLTLMGLAGGVGGWYDAAFLAGLYLFAALVWWLNQRAVECTHRPRRRELARTLRRFREEE